MWCMLAHFPVAHLGTVSQSVDKIASDWLLVAITAMKGNLYHVQEM